MLAMKIVFTVVVSFFIPMLFGTCSRLKDYIVSTIWSLLLGGLIIFIWLL